jgi:hypothetical protein
LSRRSLRARLLRLENKIDATPKPWLVLRSGEDAPDPLPERFGGVVRIKIFDGRKPKEA